MIRVASSLRFVALTLVALMIVNSPAIAGPVFKISSEGDYAFVSTSDQTGCLYLYLEIGRASAKATSQTWMYYDLYDYCSQQLVGYGSGNIPDTALQVTGKKVALKVTVASTPSFYNEGSTGTIALAFTPNRTFKRTFSGHETLAYLDRVIKWHGWSSYVAAQVSGTVLGTRIATLDGGVGESRGREMEIERSGK
jgi:hypothetical protein